MAITTQIFRELAAVALEISPKTEGWYRRGEIKENFWLQNYLYS